MLIGNVELVQECCLTHRQMRTEKIKHYKEKEGDKIMKMERNIAGTKKRSSDGVTLVRRKKIVPLVMAIKNVLSATLRMGTTLMKQDK